MNGIRYYRIEKGMTQHELAALAGVSIATIVSMEQMERPHGIYTYNYKKVRDVLGIPLDELIRNDFPDREDAGYASVPYASRTENPNNCISEYRREKKLSFQKLAERLGATSRECGRKACVPDIPLEKHIQTLAAYEGISVEEFIRRYSPKQEDVA